MFFNKGLKSLLNKFSLFEKKSIFKSYSVRSEPYINSFFKYKTLIFITDYYYIQLRMLEESFKDFKMTFNNDEVNFKKLLKHAKEAFFIIEDYLLENINRIPNIISDEISDHNKVVERVNFNVLGKKFKYNLTKDSLKFSGGSIRRLEFSLDLSIYVDKLINLFKNNAINNGFVFINSNELITVTELYSSGHLPLFKDALFKLEDSSNKFLAPTSEVYLLNFLLRNNFYGNFFAFSRNFRKEGGNYGSYDKYIRLNEFSKLELFSICDKEQSDSVHNFMLDTASSILDKLQLNYRIVLNSFSDTSHISFKTFDIEVWSPSKRRWVEVSSVSNVLSYQIDRFFCYNNTDYMKNYQNKHCLNGTGGALERILFLLIDNNKIDILDNIIL